MEKLGPTERIFIKFYIWVLFDNLSRKFKNSLKSAKDNGYFTWRPIYIFDHVSLNASENKNISDKFVEKIKTGSSKFCFMRHTYLLIYTFKCLILSYSLQREKQ